MCSRVFEELDNYIKYNDQTKITRKKFKNFKPYWSNDLTELWRDMVDSEKNFKRCPKLSANRSRLLDRFKEISLTKHYVMRSVITTVNLPTK